MQGGRFPAGEHFASIGEFLRVNHVPDIFHHGYIGFAEHFRQVLALLHADPVLAGDRTAQLNAQSHNLSGQSVGAFQCPWLAAIVENQRMKVAITRVKNIGDADIVSLPESLNFR